MSERRSDRILVIIPAFNEEASLEHVVAGIRAALPGVSIAVIDDGSRDNTPGILGRLGTITLRMPYHVGVGAAEQTGFRLAERLGYDLVVRNDGDGQHNPAEIPILLEMMSSAGADVVIGSRYLEPRGYVTPRLRRMGILLLAAVASLACRQRVTDPTSGFRAFNRRAIVNCARAYPYNYPEPESVVQFVRSGLRVREVAVTMNPRYGGVSSIRLVDSTVYMLKALMAILVSLLRSAPRVGSEDAKRRDGP